MTPHRTLFRHSLVACTLLGAGFVAHGAGSIVVAPTALYMDHQTRSAEITLYNPTDVPEEVVIEPIFGYPATDGEGRLYLHVAPGEEDPRSAAAWLRAFPDRVVVPPGGRQVVRVFGDPPSDLPDGEYWARMVITARGQSVPIQAPAGSEIHVGLDLEVRTLIAATYRKGTLATGLDVSDFAPVVENGSLVLHPRLLRTGDAAWIGSLQVRIFDAAGAERALWTEQIAVYREYHRRLSYPLEGLAPGRYRVEATFASDRDDIPARFRLPAPPVSRTAELLLP